ncbi:MAG: hypothetical protein CVU39_19530 [Chloroflexi bacterium HGW-Chloroflexi-10]|nr:MAG: hypothetical protein CVU39_19530 [Chloroflexi bacterium HGW-Chloroflexi-10]
MNYKVSIEGFEGQDIELKYSMWTGAKLLVNGKLAPKGMKRGEMQLKRNDGFPVTATFKPNFLGLDAPNLFVDGKTIVVAESFKWYQWIWIILPVSLVFVGGLLGGLIGATGFILNSKIFRTDVNGVLKFLIAGGITAASVIAYFTIATLFSVLLNQ